MRNELKTFARGKHWIFMERIVLAMVLIRNDAILARIFWFNVLGGTKLSSQNIHSERKEKKKKPFTIGKKLKRHPYCHVHNLSKHWARDFAWIMLNLAEFSISIYLAILLYVCIYGENEHWTQCNDNMGNEVNLWRCIPQMKFHFMNEFTNGTHTHTHILYVSSKHKILVNKSWRRCRIWDSHIKWKAIKCGSHLLAA